VIHIYVLFEIRPEGHIQVELTA